MKLKLFLALVALAGLASALALASPTQAGDGKHGSTDGDRHVDRVRPTGTTTGKKDHDGDRHHGNASCQQVELRGTNGSGSVALMVTKANSKGSSLVGKQVTLTVPAGSTVGATACVDSGGRADRSAAWSSSRRPRRRRPRRRPTRPRPRTPRTARTRTTSRTTDPAARNREGRPDEGCPSRFPAARAIVRPSPGGLRRVHLAVGQPLQLIFRVAPTFRLFARIKPSKGGCST